jgi:CheY-like chemotaxis protein
VAATVAHELNNPLMGVRACLQLLAATASPEQAELVQMACAEIDRAGTIVDDLRRYARRQDDQRRTLRPTDLVNRLLRMRRLGRPDDALRLAVEVSETLPMVHGDEGQLLQALSNLLRNAEQAVASMPAARRAVALRARVTDDALVFEVEDRGVGVSAEVRPRLFDPFFSTKPVGEGTGLGLTVVQSIAEGHGGRVEVVDTPGGGATFRLWLPCAPGEGSARAERTPSLRAAAVRGLRVLLADDEPVLRAAMRRLGAMQGMEVTVAEDATEALAALDSADFDVVLLDVIMPGGGGLAVLRALQAERPALTSRALLLSGETGDALRGVEGLTLPPLLRKPFDLNDLLGWIERLGRGASAQPASR